MIDGLRSDYLQRIDLPFLRYITQNGYCKIISEPLTYQTRPTYFAGLYPKESNIANLFWLEQENSPFKFLKIFPLRILNKLCVKFRFLNFGIRYLIKKLAKCIEKWKGNTASCLYLDTVNIPLYLLPFFGFSEKKNIFEKNAYKFKTLFDYLRNSNNDWTWIAYPTHLDLTVSAIKTTFNNHPKKDNSKFIFIHFAELDWIGHDFGPESDMIAQKLKKIDQCINFIYDYYQNKGIEVKITVFGDHGMVPVNENINIIEYLSKRGIIFSKRDIYFIDSNMFRFWSKNEKKNQQIEKFLKVATFGELLTKDKQKEYQYIFNHNKFGEILFLTNPGVVFFPNFFQFRDLPKGMHGYGPKCELNNTLLIIFEEKIKDKYSLSKENHDLTDIFYVFLQLLQLEKNYIIKPEIKSKILDFKNKDLF